jgi:hypothetical protein
VVGDNEGGVGPLFTKYRVQKNVGDAVVGLLDGLCEGFLEGLTDGFSEGYVVGLLDGLCDGFLEG